MNETATQGRICIPAAEAMDYAVELRKAALFLARYNNDELAFTVGSMIRLARILEGRR